MSGLFVVQISPRSIPGSLDKVLVNTESNRTYHSGITEKTVADLSALGLSTKPVWGYLVTIKAKG